MKELFLMRHGKAETHRSGLRDFDRCLAQRGGENARRQALRVSPSPHQHMLVSNAMRTLQTAEMLHAGWRKNNPQSLPSLEIKEQGYLAPADIWMGLIQMTEPSIQGLWIIGHNPGISDLVTQLTGDYLGMATADIVHIHLQLDEWTEIQNLCGTVVSHLTGRDA